MEVVGLNEENIKSISSIKNEDLWTLEYRLESFNLFNDISLPSFGPKIDIDFDKIIYYKGENKRYEGKIFANRYCLYSKE